MSVRDRAKEYEAFMSTSSSSSPGHTEDRRKSQEEVLESQGAKTRSPPSKRTPPPKPLPPPRRPRDGPQRPDSSPLQSRSTASTVTATGRSSPQMSPKTSPKKTPNGTDKQQRSPKISAVEDNKQKAKQRPPRPVPSKRHVASSITVTAMPYKKPDATKSSSLSRIRSYSREDITHGGSLPKRPPPAPTRTSSLSRKSRPPVPPKPKRPAEKVGSPSLAKKSATLPKTATSEEEHVSSVTQSLAEASRSEELLRESELSQKESDVLMLSKEASSPVSKSDDIESSKDDVIMAKPITSNDVTGHLENEMEIVDDFKERENNYRPEEENIESSEMSNDVSAINPAEEDRSKPILNGVSGNVNDSVMTESSKPIVQEREPIEFTTETQTDLIAVVLTNSEAHIDSSSELRDAENEKLENIIVADDLPEALQKEDVSVAKADAMENDISSNVVEEDVTVDHNRERERTVELEGYSGSSSDYPFDEESLAEADQQHEAWEITELSEEIDVTHLKKDEVVDERLEVLSVEVEKSISVQGEVVPPCTLNGDGELDKEHLVGRHDELLEEERTVETVEVRDTFYDKEEIPSTLVDKEAQVRQEQQSEDSDENDKGKRELLTEKEPEDAEIEERFSHEEGNIVRIGDEDVKEGIADEMAEPISVVRENELRSSTYENVSFEREVPDEKPTQVQLQMDEKTREQENETRSPGIYENIEVTNDKAKYNAEDIKDETQDLENDKGKTSNTYENVVMNNSMKEKEETEEIEVLEQPIKPARSKRKQKKQQNDYENVFLGDTKETSETTEEEALSEKRSEKEPRKNSYENVEMIPKSARDTLREAMFIQATSPNTSPVSKSKPDIFQEIHPPQSPPLLRTPPSRPKQPPVTSATASSGYPEAKPRTSSSGSEDGGTKEQRTPPPVRTPPPRPAPYYTESSEIPRSPAQAIEDRDVARARGSSEMENEEVKEQRIPPPRPAPCPKAILPTSSKEVAEQEYDVPKARTSSSGSGESDIREPRTPPRPVPYTKEIPKPSIEVVEQEHYVSKERTGSSVSAECEVTEARTPPPPRPAPYIKESAVSPTVKEEQESVYQVPKERTSSSVSVDSEVMEPRTPPPPRPAPYIKESTISSTVTEEQESVYHVPKGRTSSSKSVGSEVEESHTPPPRPAPVVKGTTISSTETVGMESEYHVPKGRTSSSGSSGEEGRGSRTPPPPRPAHYHIQPSETPESSTKIEEQQSEYLTPKSRTSSTGSVGNEFRAPRTPPPPRPAPAVKKVSTEATPMLTHEPEEQLYVTPKSFITEERNVSEEEDVPKVPSSPKQKHVPPPRPARYAPKKSIEAEAPEVLPSQDEDNTYSVPSSLVRDVEESHEAPIDQQKSPKGARKHTPPPRPDPFTREVVHSEESTIVIDEQVYVVPSSLTKTTSASTEGATNASRPRAPEYENVELRTDTVEDSDICNSPRTESKESFDPDGREISEASALYSRPATVDEQVYVAPRSPPIVPRESVARSEYRVPKTSFDQGSERSEEIQPDNSQQQTDEENVYSVPANWAALEESKEAKTTQDRAGPGSSMPTSAEPLTETIEGRDSTPEGDVYAVPSSPISTIEKPFPEEKEEDDTYSVPKRSSVVLTSRSQAPGSFKRGPPPPKPPRARQSTASIDEPEEGADHEAEPPRLASESISEVPEDETPVAAPRTRKKQGKETRDSVEIKELSIDTASPKPKRPAPPRPRAPTKEGDREYKHVLPSRPPAPGSSTAGGQRVSLPVAGDSDSDSDAESHPPSSPKPTGPPRKKTYHITHEILTTERTFVEALRLVYEDCYGTIKEADVAPETTLNEIFKDLGNIYHLDNRFLQELEERMKTWEDQERIGDIVKKYGHFLKMYTTYINNYDKAANVLQETMKENLQFAELVHQFQTSEKCKGLMINSFMLKPVQRIPSYRLLLIDYLKHLSEDSVEYKDIKVALDIVSEVATHINESMKRVDNFEQVLRIQGSLVGHEEIVKPGREFIRQGMLMKLCRKDMQERMFFLLTDVLLYTIPVGNQYKLREILPLLGMKVMLPESQDFENEFSIISTTRSFTLSASTPAERDEWLEELDKAIDAATKKKISFFKSGKEGTVPKAEQEVETKLGAKAPVWIPDARVTMCMLCTEKFTVTNRRHHCRGCGKVVCGSCSDNLAPLPYLDYSQARVCELCYDVLLKEQNREVIADEKEFVAPLPTHVHDESLEKINRKPAKFEILHRFKPGSKKHHQRKSKMIRPSVCTEVVGNESGSQVSGYLRCKRVKHGWKRLWFVLKDNVLYTYKASEDVVAQETIPILGYTVVEAKKDGDDFVFHLKHAGLSPILFKTDSESSTTRWIQELKKATTL